MKTNRIFQIIFVTVSIISLLALGYLTALNEQPALAEGGGMTVTGEKILVSLSNDTTGWSDDTLYAINPADGSGQTKIFDFHNHPNNSPLSSGQVFAPRISTDGKQIYFHSEFAYAYTPARRNAFWIGSNGATVDQITPGEKSGMWGQSGNSIVSGQVRRGDGTGWGNAPVYLEGMSMVYADANGNFSFQNVPPGVRWLVAYRPGDLPFDSTTVNVVSGINYTGLILTPVSSYRANFEYPVAYGSRIYYRSSLTAIKWTDTDFSAEYDVYTSPADACTGIPGVDAFDVGSVSGKIAVYDYQEGCGVGNNNHNGIYTMDKDGGNKSLVADLLNASGWGDALQPQVFWSPNESRIAFKGVYNGYQALVILDISNSNILGIAYADYTSQTLTLHGWSPDGNWLLYSVYDGNPAQATLAEIKVNADGSLDVSNIITLLTNQPVSGATWGNIQVWHKIYLPLTLK